MINQTDLPLSLSTVHKRIIIPALSLFDPYLASKDAIVLLLIIGYVESGYATRLQVNGPAKGFWQCEIESVVNLFNETFFVQTLPTLASHFNVECNALSFFDQLPENDQLACCVARMNLETNPLQLPPAGAVLDSYQYYLNTWRPGKPSKTRWINSYKRVIDYVKSEENVGT